MSEAFHRENRKRVLLFALISLAWICFMIFLCQEELKRDQYRHTVLLGKAYQQSREMGENLLYLMRQEETAIDYSLGMDFLAREGYGQQGSRFLVSDSKAVLFQAAALGGIVLLAVSLLREIQICRLRCKDNKSIIASMKAFEGNENAESISCNLPDTRYMQKAVNELMVSLRRKQKRIRGVEAEVQKSLENISHQMKTPLVGLQLYIEILMQQVEEIDSRHMLQTCHQKIEQLQQMVVSLLHLAKLKAGKMPMDIQRLNLRNVMDSVLNSVQIEGEQKNLSFLIDIPELLEITADLFWLRQAFINVIRNSIFYTPPGGSISCRAWQENDCVTVDILDTGKGIPPAEWENVFQRFYSPNDENSFGTGIGLNLSRQIMERMGGSLRVTECKNGTCMRFTFCVMHGKNKK